ncbi:hypothetical protein [Desertibacillus haloalkaliphilus]|uniref:hypothetical protein n=1 Tax=Desertibacillus haloalkaliphilus TaxID=1328930 RepID=UPI001C26AC90|nr:hypothetical protein [Desertibacillus haloalkaliphilus]MBU8905435.1 hypothetical protein [Desertibacillus haloalkaliphilus]
MQIKFVRSKTMNKIVKYYAIFMIVSLLVISYLGGNHDYITVRTGWTVFFTIAGIGMCLVYIGIFTYPKAERKKFWMKHGLGILIFGLVIIYNRFFR